MRYNNEVIDCNNSTFTSERRGSDVSSCYIRLLYPTLKTHTRLELEAPLSLRLSVVLGLRLGELLSAVILRALRSFLWLLCSGWTLVDALVQETIPI